MDQSADSMSLFAFRINGMNKDITQALLDHVHDLDGIVCILLILELYKAIPQHGHQVKARFLEDPQAACGFLFGDHRTLNATSADHICGASKIVEGCAGNLPAIQGIRLEPSVPAIGNRIGSAQFRPHTLARHHHKRLPSPPAGSLAASLAKNFWSNHVWEAVPRIASRHLGEERTLKN